MKLSYFPGCTLKNKAKDLDTYARKSALALGVELEEIETLSSAVRTDVHPEANIIFGLRTDDMMGDDLQAMIIATTFEESTKRIQ